MLWGVFVVAFGVVAAATLLPVWPLVGVLPLWAAVVLGAVGAVTVVAVAATAAGWPADAGEVSDA